MISQFLKIENVAYYSIGAFIAALVDIPSRGMFQIINPMVSEVLSENNFKRLKTLRISVPQQKALFLSLTEE